MKKIIFAAALLAVPFIGHAEQKEQGSGPNPYTECGIGAAIFQETAWAAATSNATWDLGSTAITSAMSSPETCNAKKVNTAKLILETLDGLENDIASGGGQYTVELAQVTGCGAAQHDALVGELRKAYSPVVEEAGYASQPKEVRAARMYDTVKAAAGSMSKSCATSL